MLAAGLIEAWRGLVARWGPEVRPLESVGYREAKAHLSEGVPLEETERRIYKATRIYARRQRTWFRGEGARWATAEQVVAEADALDRFVHGAG